ncbi:patatin-like phospholipase family protein [Flavobacterium coralii]|uniref:patatin-like phospholipase family protein n=1 Tax=Flavobacterium coralii TaxID=2838017 RepID=UPI000C358FE9|nr:hypothetical protein [Flavobacterium sp.]
MDKKFEIGLCMAGAVSAGAYTAGVIDYLLETLEEWEKRRGEENVPSHQVSIPIIGGASAGGMTGLLLASALQEKHIPVQYSSSNTQITAPHPENKLYHSWVDLLNNDVFSKMLDVSDIKNGSVVSLLNSQFIEEIAAKMITGTKKAVDKLPAFFENNDGSPLKIFTTLTNLEGFCYYAGLNAAGRQEKYYMRVHNDYGCFELINGNATPTGNEWMPLNFATGQNVSVAVEAAMATGAFPVGLAPRTLTRPSEYVNQIPWLKYIFRNSPVKDGSYTSLNIDGGVINNEPFEKVRDLLNETLARDKGMPYTTDEEKAGTNRVLDDINCDYSSFTNTVLMVDPFPSAEAEIFDANPVLTSVIPKTLGAMLSQMRAKPQEYKELMKENDASSFIISPSREIRDKNGNVIEDVFGEKAIACGTLSGFGGFLHKEFRIHDFYLGRYNCEIFLRDYFTVPESALQNNPIFANGYSGVANKDDFASSATKPGEEKQYQIIPIFSERTGEFKIPVFSCGDTWPKIKVQDIDKYEQKIRKRVGKLIMELFTFKGLARPLMFIGTKVVINKFIAGKAMDIIKLSLKKWKLL